MPTITRSFYSWLTIALILSSGCGTESTEQDQLSSSEELRVRNLSRGSIRNNELLTTSIRAPAALSRRLLRNSDTKRVRFVSNRVSNIKTNSDRLTLKLFDDLTVTARRKTSQKTRDGITKWSGLVDGFEGHPVNLVRSGSVVFGKVVHGDHVYVIQNVSRTMVAVQELDRVATPPCGNDGALSPPSAVEHGPVTTLPSFARSATIDVMVVYTEEAKLGAGLGISFIGDLMIKLQIELAVLEMNNALRRSDVRHRVRLVHMMQVDGSDIENEESRDQLYWIRDRMNDSSDLINAARETYKADIVSLWVEKSDGACGRGFVYNLSSDFAERATHMVVRSCQIKKYSFLHEFGHNLGGNHDWAVSTTDTPYIYSHGYALWDVDFPMIPVRTLMAYDDICEYVGVNCPRIPVFSNPDYEILGHPLGIEYADVHRTINNTGYAISRFR